jgi:hypothetical protein
MTDNVVLPITGEELQTLIATIKNGGIQGTGVNGYRFAMNSTSGKLELYKDETLIAMQDDDGSWFKTAVSTGVGSLHLGGGESSDPAHSISSAGQNVVFKNESFSATPDQGMVWFPAGWQGISANLDTLNAPTYLQFGAKDSSLQPNGNSTTGGVPYNFSVTIASNIVISSVQVQLDEGYSGKLTNIIMSQVKGVELHSSSTTVENALAGSVITIPYPTLYFARAGDALTLQIKKEDGSFLRCRRGTTNTSLPWRRLTVRPFTDITVGNVHVGDIKDFYGTNDHDGWVFMDGRNVNTLTATQRAAAATIGISSVVPDARNRFGVGAGNLYGRGVNGGDLQIKRSALPNVALSFSATTGTESNGHTHDPGTMQAGMSGSQHVHQFAVDALSFRGDAVTNTNGGDGDGSRSFQTQNDGQHTHGITGTTSNVSANHTHSVSGNTASMNGGVTQTDHLPPYIAFGKFIYLGL